MRKKLLMAVGLVSVLAATGAWGETGPLATVKYEPKWESVDSRPTPQWWVDAKFGIFIHWGPYAVPAYAPVKARGWGHYSEWYQGYMQRGNQDFIKYHAERYGNRPYANFAAEFTAENFNAGDWAKLFKRAGAKYVVLTSKHHDGFALWPSLESPYYNSVAMGPGRDLAREFADAMRAEGLKRGFYFSMLEYANPLYPCKRDGKMHPRALSIKEWSERVNIPQLKELANDYEADIIWPDGEWDYHCDLQGAKGYLAWLYNESKVRDTVVVNDRWGAGSRGHHGGHYTTEYSEGTDGVKADGTVHPWEECRGIGGSFGYNRFETPDEYMSAEKCIEMLVSCASRGGNLLLNVGPTADGRIPPIMQDRLLAMGDWLKVNGEAIYGTTRWNGADRAWAKEHRYFTCKGDNLYFIFFDWPTEPLAIAKTGEVGEATLLGSTAKIAFENRDGGVVVDATKVPANSLPCKHAWVIKLALKQ